MFSSLTLTRPLIISLAVISTVGIVSAAFFQFSGTAGVSHILGQFFSDGTTGNAGTVSFNQITNPAGLNGDQLVGDFYLETVGVVSFMPGTKIIPPTSGRPADLWPVSGTASGVYCGLITLTGVFYDPVGERLVGAGWNQGVGRVPFDSIISTTSSTGFEGRVKVLGNIGGNSSFETYYSLGSRFNASLFNDTLNSIRKNTALLTRNIPVSFYNSTFDGSTATPVGNKLFFINTGSITKTLTYNSISTNFPTSAIDSLIIIGGNLIIDADMSTIYSRAKGIIVLKNEAGVGGNIIIRGTVKKIESSIFTEGTLYSGDSIGSLYNDTTARVAILPENQLHIHGALMSRNTIGGSSTSPATCVYGETSCDNTVSIRYDLNYFRGAPATRAATSPTTRAFRDNTLDNYSLIIETDTRLTATPPPGF